VSTDVAPPQVEALSDVPVTSRSSRCFESGVAVGEADGVCEEEIVGFVQTTSISSRDEHDVVGSLPRLLGVGVCSLGQSGREGTRRAGDPRDIGGLIECHGGVLEGDVRLRQDTVVTLQRALCVGAVSRASPC
jgi:hypothetical protein